MLLKYSVRRIKYQILETTLGYKKSQQTDIFGLLPSAYNTLLRLSMLFSPQAGKALFIFLIQAQTQKCLTSFYSGYPNWNALQTTSKSTGVFPPMISVNVFVSWFNKGFQSAQQVVGFLPPLHSGKTSPLSHQQC